MTLSFNTNQPAYRDLRGVVAERTEPLVFWIGAGASANAGLPTWSGLRDSLLSDLKEKARSHTGDAREHFESRHRTISGFDDTWLAFSRLRDALGETTFRACIRRELQPASSVEIPQLYKNIWRVRPAGILNLNLDRLATRAFHAGDTEGQPIGFLGFNVGENTHILKQHNPFIVNLHGNIGDQNSWVLTRESLTALTERESYRNFLNACLSSKTVVFIGLTVDDIAVGGHLRRVRNIAEGTGRHFWIADDSSVEMNSWAEELGLSVVNYSTGNDDHSEVNELFADLLSYVSEDEPQWPVVSASSEEPLELPPPSELATRDPNEIRELLNIAANEILESRTERAYEEFSEFCEEYDEAIYRAWYLRDEEGHNQLLDYTLEEKVDEGAFGEVYCSQGEGEQVAVKVLHERVRRERRMLETFRRGIHSMKILEKRSVDGVVNFKDASEIPAFVVMDWVRGPTLTEAVEANQIDSWDLILEVALQVAEIVHSAHRVPERVLHRDLRPNNVMLKRWWSTSRVDVIVLDFDLSWHRGSVERSIEYEAAPNGYLAPEQLKHEEDDVSTRHAAVDSFGLGMTIYFMLKQTPPVPGVHKHDDWAEQVDQAAERLDCSRWRSVPDRVARVIKNATRHSQHQRWDLSQILGELQLLLEALRHPDKITSSEMIAQELAARIPQSGRMSWDPDDHVSEFNTPTGTHFELGSNEEESTVTLRIGWKSQGRHEHQSVAKWIPDAVERTQARLSKGDWSLEDVSYSNDQANIVAMADAKEVRDDFDGYSTSIGDAIAEMTFG